MQSINKLGSLFVSLVFVATTLACNGQVDDGASGFEPVACEWEALDTSDLQIDGQQVNVFGGVWGSSQDDVYLAASSSSSEQVVGSILHYDGVTWMPEELPVDVLVAIRAQGNEDGSQVVAAVLDSEYDVRLLQKNSDSWSIMQGHPALSLVNDIVYAGDEVFVIGLDTSDQPLLARFAAGAWESVALPPAFAPYELNYGFGTAEGAIFTGSVQDGLGYWVGGVIVRYDGTSWEALSAPTECWGLGSVHGINLEDAFFTCYVGENSSIVYQVAGDQFESVATLNGIHVPLWSFSADAAVTVGFDMPEGEIVGHLPEVPLYSSLISEDVTSTVLNRSGQLPNELWFDNYGGGLLTTFDTLYSVACD